MFGKNQYLNTMQICRICLKCYMAYYSTHFTKEMTLFNSLASMTWYKYVKRCWV